MASGTYTSFLKSRWNVASSQRGVGRKVGRRAAATHRSLDSLRGHFEHSTTQNQERPFIVHHNTRSQYDSAPARL